MDIAELIAALSQPAGYSFPVNEVVVHQTHISAVFLAGEFAYKIKKPVALGFLDFSTPAKRRFYCEEEVRLNRRLAPSVYLAVVPVTRAAEGVRMEGSGEVVEWAVKMARLPAEATLEACLQRGEVTPPLVEELARRLSHFHASADAGPHIASFGDFPVVSHNARENFTQSRGHVGVTVSPAVHARLRELTEAELCRLEPLIRRRAEHGLTRDTHGDLRLDHVYWFPDRRPPEDVVVIDCIEFNERFRYADPVADMAFLFMDLKFHGRGDLAKCLADAYFPSAGDAEGLALLPFYVAYRAVVRAKVEGFELTEAEIPAADRSAAGARARGHWLLALGELEARDRRPCLVLVAGLPGTGKSTLAKALVEQAGFAVIRTDLVRKELAGVDLDEPIRVAFGQGLYAAEWTEKTYLECLRRARALLFDGKRVVVDANFREERWRQAFLQTAREWCVPGAMILCEADADTIRTRLAARQGDASDADWQVHLRLAETWQPVEATTIRQFTRITTEGKPEQATARVFAVLKQLQVA